MFLAPMERRPVRRREARRDFFLRLARRDLERERAVLVRIEHDELTVSGRHGVDAAVRVQRRVILVGRNFIVHERVIVADVTTRLRSTPPGRGGAGGTSPLAMRSVQSAYVFSERSFPCVLSTAYMELPRTPVPRRHSHASACVLRSGFAAST